jgi:prophage DNA circulation protein
MSLDSALGGIKDLTNQVQGGINTVTRIAADFGLGTVGAAGNSAFWIDQLSPASYRGVPFGVLGGEAHFGRRNAVHEYPFRDTVWVEDLGRSARRISLSGFLVGNDCIAQRERMIAACEERGNGQLVHPTLGLMTVNLLGALNVTERWDRGRMFELSFVFIESGERIFPSIEPSGGAVTDAAADAADIAIAGDFASRAKDALQNGAAVVSQAVQTSRAWTSAAQVLGNDATNLTHMVSSLTGNLGRFAGGANIGGLTGSLAALASGGGAKSLINVATGAAAPTLTALTGSVSIQSLTALGSAARVQIAAAASKITAAAASLGL